MEGQTKAWLGQSKIKSSLEYFEQNVLWYMREFCKSLREPPTIWSKNQHSGFLRRMLIEPNYN
jgi:hypothetical protein